MKKLGIYYRVSTEAQDFNMQKHAVQEWFLTNPRPQEQVVYQDHGYSGANSLRPQYTKLLQDAYALKLSCIVVYRLDRLNRSAKEAIHVLTTLGSLGLEFISVTQPILNLGPQNPFAQTMLAAFAEIAEIERTMTVECVKSGLQAAKSRGVKLGAPSKNTPEIRRAITRHRLQGWSLRKIAQHLDLSYGLVQRITHEATGDL